MHPATASACDVGEIWGNSEDETAQPRPEPQHQRDPGDAGSSVRSPRESFDRFLQLRNVVGSRRRGRSFSLKSVPSLLVDVESGPDGALYALSQGDSPGNVPPATPALPDSGELLLLNRNGSFSVLADELDLPTSLDFIGSTAFVTTLNGEVWKITNVSKFKH